MRWPWTEKSDVIKDNTVPVRPGIKAIVWISSAFIATIALTYILIFWRFSALYPAKWCGLAKVGSPDILSACQQLLLADMNINGDVLRYLVILSGILSICLAVVALQVNVKAGAFGGNIDIGADRTTITQPDGHTVTIPTPPATDQGK